jgi:hypothetical protein
MAPKTTYSPGPHTGDDETVRDRQDLPPAAGQSSRLPPRSQMRRTRAPGSE